MASQCVFQALRLLAPHDVPGISKIRIGGVGDGGYVLLDDLDPAQLVMSFGVGPSVAFDLDMAQRGHRVLMFDHTIESLPSVHADFTWYRQGVSAVSQPDKNLFSLADHMAKLPAGAVDPILKMDVEGAERDALAAAPPGLLARFAQITLELHGLLGLDEPAFNARVLTTLRALNAEFVPVHVHGNNFGTLGQVGGFACVETLEITYVRRSRSPTLPSKTVYPTPFDTPNFDERPDFMLWFFPFLPGSECLELATNAQSSER